MRTLLDLTASLSEMRFCFVLFFTLAGTSVHSTLAITSHMVLSNYNGAGKCNFQFLEGKGPGLLVTTSKGHPGNYHLLPSSLGQAQGEETSIQYFF